MEHVKPNPARDVRVRDPQRGHAVMPAEGYPVDTSSAYWARRLRDGDVVRLRAVRPAPEPRPVKRAAKEG
jgi:hypothetical protein